MKTEMITLKVGDATIKLPANTVAQLALASVISQVVPPTISAANVAAVSEIPVLGAYWPGQGGVNAGLVRAGESGRDYYLIVAIGDKAEGKGLAFGGYGESINGADSAWDGQSNTADLLGADIDHPAAKFAASFECEGHKDFYLPARRELQIAEANVSEAFSKEWHWSSTQRSAYGAFSQTFVDGGQVSGAKSNELRVRPVRRLFI